MDRKWFLLLFFGLVASQCTLKFLFRPKCTFYRYSDPNCVIGLEESTCPVLRVTYNEFACPKYFCVSIIKMCYSRDSFCQCCLTFIKILSVSTCYKSESHCSNKWVFPKLIETCQNCLICKAKCTLSFKFPRKWKQPTSDFIWRIEKNKQSFEITVSLKTECK